MSRNRSCTPCWHCQCPSKHLDPFHIQSPSPTNLAGLLYPLLTIQGLVWFGTPYKPSLASSNEVILLHLELYSQDTVICHISWCWQYLPLWWIPQNSEQCESEVELPASRMLSQTITIGRPRNTFALISILPLPTTDSSIRYCTRHK